MSPSVSRPSRSPDGHMRKRKHDRDDSDDNKSNDDLVVDVQVCSLNQ